MQAGRQGGPQGRNRSSTGIAVSLFGWGRGGVEASHGRGNPRTMLLGMRCLDVNSSFGDQPSLSVARPGGEGTGEGIGA